MFFTSSSRIKETTDYKKIIGILSRMDQSGIVWMGRGQCISMSEIIRTALSQVGIKVRMVECQAIITSNIEGKEGIVTVGYDGLFNPGEIDTHIVCVTETEIPMIIDASVSHLLPGDSKIVVDELQHNLNGLFCDCELDSVRITYQQKSNPKVAFQYQSSILERIETDRKVFKSIDFLKILIIVALVISSLNATRGFYDFYERYYNEKNLVGPSGVKALKERLERIENLINEQP
jgi:hypothetical protein